MFLRVAVIDRFNCNNKLNGLSTDTMSPEEGPLHVTECLKKLVGHSNRVTNLAWSPHRDGELVSVSFDGNAIVSRSQKNMNRDM